MNSYQMPLFGSKHLNRGLFSDYYLDEIVPRRDDWFSLANEARPIYEALWALLAQIHPEELDEAQLENEWVQPVLEYLGHSYSVQVKIRFQQTGHRKPDYVFTRTVEDARALTSHIYAPQELSHGLAVGDAKRWGTNLDQSGPGQHNPSQQIDEYLRYSELPWGILTDGRYWRLYERETSKNNVYYAANLIDLLRGGDLDSFLYFYAFFRQEAFTGDWLREVLEGSVSFAQRLSERLEDQVYEALELIAQGFLIYRRNRLKPTPDTLQTIYEQSLVLLYRLLFIFYAESREILPIENELYRPHSLDSIKRNIVLRGLNIQRSDATVYYTQLSDLFFGLDQGDPSIGLPAYNGRLFTEADHPFLTANAVGDAYLGLALDKLARIDDPHQPGKRVFVDYRDLDVRHLGAIYEKLLEYQLDVAAEPLTVKEGKYIPARNGETVIKKPGEVYLRTGSHERKITGSYYTPDYIVRFIVEHTLKPLLNEITSRYATRDAEEQWQVYDPAGLRAEVMALNILDPATGSGHFLVDAAAYIAEWLRDLNLAPADLETGEDELIYWKRQVVNACIYGVDVNPLAVELAKLSLWLATLASGKPLSFLDHHVRCGNSLVGARVRDIGAQLTDLDADKRSRARHAEDEAAGQLTLLDDEDFAPAMSFAVGAMADIESTRAGTVDKVKQQEQLYTRLSGELAVWKRIADVWLARYFGLALDQDTWAAVRAYLLAQNDDEPDVEAVLKQAAQMAGEHRFLHWELAFPEIFFQPDGKPLENSGFDAVIGNPPYVRQQTISAYKPYLSMNFDVFHNNADLFLYFYEIGIKYLRTGCKLGYITSSTYTNTNAAKPFRKYIDANAAFAAYVDFGAIQPFQGVDLATSAAISILSKIKMGRPFPVLLIEGRTLPSDLNELFEQSRFDCLPDVTSFSEWRFQPAEATSLFRKLTNGHAVISEIYPDSIHYGVLTGLTEAFVVDGARRDQLIAQDARSAEIIKPFVRGQHLRPWYQEKSGEFLIIARQGIDIDVYPAVREHLFQYRERLEVAPAEWDKSKDGKWQGRTYGNYKWFEWHDTVAYYEKFEQPKICWSDISRFPRFSWDESHYFNNTVYMISEASYTLLGLLQSRALWYAISQIATPLNIRLGLWRYRLFAQFIERLPIPDLTAGQESQLAEIAEAITVYARDRYHLHEAMRHRIAADLGQGGQLNRRLEEWWLLEEVSALRAEIKKAFEADIPLSERDDWDKYLAAQKAHHRQMTGEIVRLETQMNAIVYDAFKLTPDEIALIERSTKYPYGEV